MGQDRDGLVVLLEIWITRQMENQIEQCNKLMIICTLIILIATCQILSDLMFIQKHSKQSKMIMAMTKKLVFWKLMKRQILILIMHGTMIVFYGMKSLNLICLAVIKLDKNAQIVWDRSSVCVSF